MAFLKDITLGQYYPGNSYLHRLDPRSKLLTSLILMTGLLVSHNWTLILLEIGVCLLAVGFSKVPIGVFMRNLKWFVWLFSITFAIHALDVHVKGTLPYFGVALSEAGLRAGLLYTVRLVLLIVFAALLTLTTVPVALTDGLERLLAPLKRFKLPVHEFAFMMTLALRFIPILIQEGERVKNAQLSRGASLEGPLLQRIRNMVPMLLPLFISAIRRADDLAIAMAARNYTGGDGRTSYSQLAWGQADYITVTLSLLMLSAVLLLSV